MPIYQAGALNTTALSAPGVYLQIQPPPLIINGVPSNLLGLVGVASWGPVNAPTLVGSPGDVTQYIGANTVRKYDLATACEVAFKFGATAIQYVRVTDSTDTAASLTLKDTFSTPATGATLTGFYTGTIGNTITAGVVAGSAANTFKLTIQRPGATAEVFDNIPGSSASVFWPALVSAVNNGQSSGRGPSQMVVASIGVATALPNIVTVYTASGGLDGATTMTDALLVGTDGVGTAKKGMYALRGTGCQVGTLIDHTDSTAWASILAYGLSEGTYMGVQSPNGSNYSATSTLLNTAGADGYGIKTFVGDWITYYDNTNGQNRTIAPATVWAALQSGLSPEQSSLNKPMLGFVGTQRVAQKQPYSSAEIGAIKTARLDVITNPSPGGNYYACQTGVNSSSTNGQNGDTYTRMTNYLALTLASAFGTVIGKNQTSDLRLSAQNAMQAFLTTLWRAKMIGDSNNSANVPFTVEIDAANNPAAAVANGYMTANVAVKFWAVVFYFVINLQGGQTVVIQSTSKPNTGI